MSEKDAPDNTDISENLRKVKHKIVVMSGKGGVGKSTVAANLAMALSVGKAKVGLLDVDIHGPNIPKMLHIEDEHPIADDDGIHPILIPQGIKVMSMGFLLTNSDTPVIWRGPMKMGVIRQFLGQVCWGDLDYLIIDLPPGTGDEPLSVAQLVPHCDGAIIVTTPQDVALLDSRKSVSFANTLKLPIIGVIENMSGFICPHCGGRTNLFKYGGGEKAAEELGVPFLGRVPIDPEIVERGDAGKPFVLDNNGSESARAFGDIVAKIMLTVNSDNKKDGGSNK